MGGLRCRGNEKGTRAPLTDLALVTGGTGFLGANLVRALCRAGRPVRVLSRGVSPAAPEAGVELVRADIGDRAAVRQALQGVGTLFHFASTTNPATAHGHAIYDIESNLAATVGLLDAAATEGIRRVVYASSGGTVYGRISTAPAAETHSTDPICSHGIVKLAVEKYLYLFRQQAGTPYTILRYANPYGPGQSMHRAQGAVAVLAGRILQRQPIEIFGDGSVVRDFIYIDDVIDATLCAAEAGEGADAIFNIGSGVGVSIRELLAALEHAIGEKADVRYLPARSFDVPVSTLDSSKAARLLGWRSRTALQDGLVPTIAWLRSELAAAVPSLQC